MAHLGPFKRFDPTQVGARAQAYREFAQKAFFGDTAGAQQIDGQTFRKNLRDFAKRNTQQQLLDLLNNTHNLKIPATNGADDQHGDPLKLMIVDIDLGAPYTASDVSPLPDENDAFYIFVIPPTPQRVPNNKAYQEMQAFESAWYHAIVDGYGL